MTPRAILNAAEPIDQKADRQQQTVIPATELTINSASAPPPTAQNAKPISTAQYTANRANAQLSTGPTSPAGRAISARNHTTHGLSGETVFAGFQVQPDENQAEYDYRLADFFNEWEPVTATEIDLVERMVVHSWLRQRATRMQDQLKINDQSTVLEYKKFEILGRYHTTHARAFNKAFSDLMKLRGFQMRQKKDEALLARRAQDFEFRFESQKRKAAEHAAKMETLHLKQEAQKQRNEKTKPAVTTAPASSSLPEALTAFTG